LVPAEQVRTFVHCLPVKNGGDAVTYRGISFCIVEMNLPHSWRWTVSKGKTVSAGVCATRDDAARQAHTFIDAIVDWSVTA
jgi:hypothetical protein